MKRIVKKIARRVAPQISAHIRQLRDVEQNVQAVNAKVDQATNQIMGRLDKLEQYDLRMLEHDFRLDRLKALATEVEPYQPTYAIEGIFKDPRRSSLDRCRTMESHLGKLGGVRLLDIGSSVGYVCYYFADRGAIAEGWEYNPKNAEVSRLVGEINGIPITVKTKQFDDETVRTIEPDTYDVVTILSVLHHVIYYNGLEYTQKLMKELLKRVPMVIVELARKGEDSKLFWDKAQPDDELDVFALVKDHVTIQKIGDFGNHLSGNTRPLYVVRAKQTVSVNGHIYAYDQKLSEAYSKSPMIYSQSIRRYYVSSEHVIKAYDFKNETDQENVRQIVAEIDNLLHIGDVYRMPRLVDFELSKQGAKVVLERRPGDLLIDVVEASGPVAPVTVAKDVLHSLADLEKQGLHHNDVRSWNVLYDGKHASLIDYGFVSHRKVDDDIVSLLWLLHAVVTGHREGYRLDKALPPKEDFKGKESLLRLYEAAKKGERSPAKLLVLL